jgi:hypothetical protein
MEPNGFALEQPVESSIVPKELMHWGTGTQNRVFPAVTKSGIVRCLF